MLKSQEHIDLMAMFEKEHKGFRLDREKQKDLWVIGQVYESGETNALFIAYRKGYALGKAMGYTIDQDIALDSKTAPR